MAKRKKKTVESEFDVPEKNKSDDMINSIAEDLKVPESEPKPHNHGYQRHVRRL